MITTLTTASSAPGATTLALALTLGWPRPVVLIEADLGRTSAILPGYYAGGTPAGWGLPELVLAAQEGTLTTNTIDAQSQPIADDKRVVPGLSTLGQAAGVHQYISDITTLITALSSGGVDVLIDAGRHTTTTPRELFTIADVIAVVTGSRLPDMMAARALIPTLPAQADSTTTGVIVVRPGQPFPPADVATVAGATLLAAVPDDATAAAHLSTGADYRAYDRSRLAGAATALAAQLVNTTNQARQRLGLDTEQQAPA